MNSVQDKKILLNTLYHISFLFSRQRKKTVGYQQSFGSGNVLLSRAVSRQVPSALRSLTSVFGMGTGGTSSLLSPDIHFLESYQLNNAKNLVLTHMFSSIFLFEIKSSTYQYQSAEHVTVLTPLTYQPHSLRGVLLAFSIGQLMRLHSLHDFRPC